MEQGLERGRAEGEKQKSLEIARRMKSKGVPSEDIADMTGLTATEIDLL
jgi:predicted transposase/invertase (TIGR01784 family)